MDKLKWKTPTPGFQETKDGKYWVKRDEKNTWRAFRLGFTDPISPNGFKSRYMAKRQCERDFLARQNPHYVGHT